VKIMSHRVYTIIIIVGPLYRNHTQRAVNTANIFFSIPGRFVIRAAFGNTFPLRIKGRLSCDGDRREGANVGRRFPMYTGVPAARIY